MLTDSEKAYRHEYEQKVGRYIHEMATNRKPPKQDTQAYIEWLEHRVECLTGLRCLELIYKCFPQHEDFGRQEFVFEVPEFREVVQQAQPKPKQGKNTKGFIYLLAVVGQPGLYKIGRTSDYKNRLATFKTKLPFEVNYEFIYWTKDMYAEESRLHTMFADKRKPKSEFFELTSDDVAYIVSLGV